MKRKNYVIEFEKDGVTEKLIKHAWNSAQRETVAIMRTIAKDTQQAYIMFDKDIVRAESKHDGFIKGVWHWKGDNGDIITFTITKVE